MFYRGVVEYVDNGRVSPHDMSVCFVQFSVPNPHFLGIGVQSLQYEARAFHSHHNLMTMTCFGHRSVPLTDDQ